MKKFLAILLSVIMAASLCMAGFAAELRTDALPGQMIVVPQNEHIAPGGEYSIPVSIVSDVEIDGVTSGSFYTGFSIAGFSGAAQQYLDITGVEFTDAVKAMAGFEGYECGFTDGAWYVSFKVDDLAVLKQTNLEVVNIIVTVSNEYPGEGVEATLDLTTYDISWLADFGAPEFDAGEAAVVVDGEGNATYLTTGSTDSQFIVNPGHLADKFDWDPAPELPWQQKLLRWFEGIALKITNGLISLLEVLSGFLEGELA